MPDQTGPTLGLPHPVVVDLGQAFVEDSSVARVDRLLQALIRLAPPADRAVAQTSLWHFPATGEIQMQRIRGRYLTRPRSESWDAGVLKVMFATNLSELADPGVAAVHRHLAEADGQELIDDYVSLVTPQVWSRMNICTDGFFRAGIHNGLTHYWRVDDLHCLNTTLWISDERAFDDPSLRQAASALFRVGKDLFQRVLMDDEVGLSILNLTDRKREVLRLALAGFNERQIAERLHRSENTVHTHMRSLYREFGAQTRAELMSLFIDEALVRPDGDGDWASGQ